MSAYEYVALTVASFDWLKLKKKKKKRQSIIINK